MKTPSFLLAAGVLFWGWQTDQWLFAIPLAVVLEAARFLPTRFEFSIVEFNRVWNLCLLTLIIVLAIPYISNKGLGSVYVILQWLPLVMAPMLAAQLYSTGGRVPALAFNLFYRENKKRTAHRPPTRMDIRYPYLALCIIGASAVVEANVWFYWAMCGLIGWAFWTARPKRFSLGLWSACMAVIVLLGYGGGHGMYDLRNYVDAQVVDWLAKRFQGETDPFKARTAIGEVIELKMDDTILFHVGYEKGTLRKVLLPQSTYNTYKSSAWYAPRAQFDSLTSRTETQWVFENQPEAGRILTVSMDLNKGKGLLLAPNSSYRFSNLPVLYLQHNPLGTLKVEKGPDFIEYQVALHPDVSRNSQPSQKDLRVPEELQPVLQQIVDDLQLTAKTPQEALAAVESYFEDNYFYSLKLIRQDNAVAPLVDFLTHTRKGHCEYFATAAALLLRQAGIPTRYVFGYSAHEYNWMQENLVVRSRDAHAWTLAYVNGRWQNFDTTPSTWIDRQEENASAFEGLFDIVSQIGFMVSYIRWGMEDGEFQTYLVYLLIPPVLFLVWRIYSRARLAQNLAQQGLGVSADELYRKVESDFKLIENQLAQMGFMREDWETYARWLGRIRRENPTAPVGGLAEAVNLHNRLRFDPQGLSPEETTRLKADIRSWLNTPS